MSVRAAEKDGLAAEGELVGTEWAGWVDEVGLAGPGGDGDAVRAECKCGRRQ